MKRESEGFLGRSGRGILVLAVAGLIVFGLTLGQAVAASFPKMDIKLGHSGVVDMSYHKGSLKFAELMKERTGGAVTVDVFPANQLGSEKDMVEQVKNGVIHISLTGPSMLAQFKGWGPIGVLGMPYVLKGNTEDEIRPKLIKLARGTPHEDLNEQAAKESGVRILDMGWWYGERHLTTKTKQVVKPDDVKGLKIRTMDSPMAKAALVALGAATTPMAVAELYTALQLGVVEGQENPLNTIYSHKFYEVQKYVALTGHMAMNLVLVINEKFYQSLSPELRADLREEHAGCRGLRERDADRHEQEERAGPERQRDDHHGRQQGRIRREDQGRLEGV